MRMKVAANKIAANSYAEPGHGHYILNPSSAEGIPGESCLFCVVDLQADVDAYKCNGLVRAVQQELSRLRKEQAVLFILWPDAGPVVPEIALPSGVDSETAVKKGDGGAELFQFWGKRGRPGNIQMMGLNLNVCIFNAVSEFIACCRDRQVDPPLIHFKVETLADSNYRDDPKFGWDHFRNVISAHCPGQSPPPDTMYVGQSSPSPALSL